jgi:hypothetical protein
MQSSASSSPGRKPPDARFGAFLFALGITLLVLVPWVLAVGIFVIILIGFTAGLLIAGGLYLIIKEAVRSSK